MRPWVPAFAGGMVAGRFLTYLIAQTSLMLRCDPGLDPGEPRSTPPQASPAQYRYWTPNTADQPYSSNWAFRSRPPGRTTAT
jgi:hypothetical protein